VVAGRQRNGQCDLGRACIGGIVEQIFQCLRQRWVRTNRAFAQYIVNLEQRRAVAPQMTKMGDDARQPRRYRACITGLRNPCIGEQIGDELRAMGNLNVKGAYGGDFFALVIVHADPNHRPKRAACAAPTPRTNTQP